MLKKVIIATMKFTSPAGADKEEEADNVLDFSSGNPLYR